MRTCCCCEEAEDDDGINNATIKISTWNRKRNLLVSMLLFVVVIVVLLFIIVCFVRTDRLLILSLGLYFVMIVSNKGRNISIPRSNEFSTVWYTKILMANPFGRGLFVKTKTPKNGDKRRFICSTCSKFKKIALSKLGAIFFKNNKRIFLSKKSTRRSGLAKEREERGLLIIVCKGHNIWLVIH